MSGIHAVVEGVRRSGARNPSATAIVEGDRVRSYGDVVEELDAAARTLHDAGVRPGHLVAVRAERIGELPVALLAIWQTGATAAIIDATLPPTRIDECERAVGPDWFLTLAPLALEGMGRSEHRAVASHVLFTSGTTGRPAAVEVSAGAIGGALDWYTGAFTFGNGDRVGLLAGLGHDPMLRDAFVPLLAGGVLAIPPPDVFARPDRLVSFIGEAGLTVLHCTPGLLELIVAAARTRLDHLRLVVSSGAALSLGTVRRLRQACDATVVNAYGCTETPQIASCEVVPQDDARLPDDSPIGIGTGVGGAELLLSEPDGEIVVRSPHLATRYVDGAGRGFQPDPLGVPGFRAYRTGDRGLRGPGGSIRVVGRLDRQLSVNGHRVAPEEIERAALGHPAVVQAVAGLITGDVVGLTVVLAAPAAIDARTLRGFLRERLPRPAVPTRIQIVPALTLNHNHK